MLKCITQMSALPARCRGQGKWRARIQRERKSSSACFVQHLGGVDSTLPRCALVCSVPLGCRRPPWSKIQLCEFSHGCAACGLKHFGRCKRFETFNKQGDSQIDHKHRTLGATHEFFLTILTTAKFPFASTKPAFQRHFTLCPYMCVSETQVRKHSSAPGENGADGAADKSKKQ